MSVLIDNWRKANSELAAADAASTPAYEAFDRAMLAEEDAWDALTHEQRVALKDERHWQEGRNLFTEPDAAHARIREQAKAWRAQEAMYTMNPRIYSGYKHPEGPKHYVQWNAGETELHPTREAAMIAAADAALGADWDAR